MSKTRVENGDFVKVHFVGKLENGTVFDTTENGPSLEFTIGAGNIIPGFEQGVIGMELNEKKTINVPPDLGYGPTDEEIIFKVRKNYFSPEAPPAIGMQLEYAIKKGEPLNVVVTDLADDFIILDGNHGLAGKTLVFDLELVEIG